jgi:nucleoside-diphosphate-sugar epimerase|tara:strand:- start:1159 stop:3201 length:2043 start_codon:yes stop_codon:yes gene_type:complete
MQKKMKQKEIKIAITCIGTGVGQSIINSIKLSSLPIKTIGFGNNPFAYGAYDCDELDYTPSIYSDNYIDDLIRKCKDHKVDLLIPSLDDEILFFANNKIKFELHGINVLYVDNKEFVSLCRDKEFMSNELNKVSNFFVKSYNRNSINSAIEKGKVHYPLIAKPKNGFSSNGIVIINRKEDLLKISDNHIIQELAIPRKVDPNYDFFINQISIGNNTQVSEISIQLVFSPSGHLMGKMYSYNKLKNGIPIEIIPFQNEYVTEAIDKLIPEFLVRGVKGSINIQGRLTDKGLKLFEINPRFTGITGLRALMGFNEVEACIKEWLGIDKGRNQLNLNYNRFGLRQTADKSIPFERNSEVLSFYEKVNDKNLKNKKTLFITGSTGYLGQNLINKLIETDDFNIIAFSLRKSKAKELFKDKVKAIYDKEDLIRGNFNFGSVDILLHLGFTRSYGSNQDIAESIEFTNKLFIKAAQNQIPAVINISSQSVYGLSTPPLWTEKTAVAPETVYAQAKYATELILESANAISKTLHYSSIRLGALAGGANGIVGDDFLSKFCQNSLKGKKIKIIGGMQQMQRFDIMDAIDAIITMIRTESKKWKPVYNLSSTQVYTLKDIAEKVIKISSQYNCGKQSSIVLEEKNVDMSFGMDSGLFYSDMNWQSKYTIEDTIKSLILYFKSEIAIIET